MPLSRQATSSLAILFVLTATVMLAPVQAADITVDANCTLNNAVVSANLNIAFGDCTAGSADEVDVITITVDVELSGTGPGITSELIIQGNTTSGDLREIDGKDLYRILSVANATATIRHLKLVNGKAREHGGAIWTLGADLTVNNVEFEGNYSGLSGGAIAATQSTDLTISSSVFKSNSTGSIGGAVAFYGSASGDETLTITETVFSGNQAAENSAGALYVQHGYTTIKRSRFADNTAESTIADDSGGGGGAIYFSQANRSLIENTTIYGNSTKGNGGGIFAIFSDIKLLHSTIVYNSAGTDAEGGGILVSDHTDENLLVDEQGNKLRHTVIQNSVIAQNVGDCQCRIADTIDDSTGVFASDGTCESAHEESSTSPLYLQTTPEAAGYFEVAAGSAILNSADGTICQFTVSR